MANYVVGGFGEKLAWRIILLVALDEWHDRRGVFPVAFSNPSRNICFEIEQDNVVEQSRLRVRVR